MEFWLTIFGLISAIVDPIEDNSNGSHPLGVIEHIEGGHGCGKDHGRGRECGAFSSNIQESEPSSLFTLSL